MVDHIAASLHANFGFGEFRPGQQEAVESLLTGRHTLVVMPTGSGKSLIYQIAALHLPGLTLVISPLIALMKDQVDGLNRRGISAAYINSALPADVVSRRLQKLADGAYRLVYIAPERLRSVGFLDAIGKQTVSLLAIDEAHCISEWGHDFRPDYLHIAAARRALGNPTTAALTATAAPQVQTDIVRLLNMSEPRRIVTGFNRPNLSLEVRYISAPEAKLRALYELVKAEPSGASLVYTGTRRDAEDAAEFLREAGVRAAHYHAGLSAEERGRVQDGFLSGRLPVVAATNAFGMGIDRADVRQVIHYSMPGTVEAYYQEAGRAGRDGLPARAVMLYTPDDRALQEWFIKISAVSVGDLRALYGAVKAAVLASGRKELWISTEEMSRRTSQPEIKVRVGLAELERAETLEHLGNEGVRMLLRVGEWNEKRIAIAEARSADLQHNRKTQLGRIVAYAETNDCRRQIILKHFGDTGPADAAVCCDNCTAGKKQPAHPHSGRVKPQTEDANGHASSDSTSLGDGERAALAILDCMRRLRNPVGRTKLAQILKGSSAADIKKFGYDKSIYYARLKVFRQSDIETLIERLGEMGYYKVIGGKYPVLALTPLGIQAIQEKAPISLKLPRTIRPNKLKNRKAEQTTGGTVMVTLELFREGLKPVEIARRRELSPITIFGHLARLIAQRQVLAQEVVSPEIMVQVMAAIEQVGGVKYLAPIKEILPEEISFEVIRCVVEGWKLEHPEETDTEPGKYNAQEITGAILACVDALPGCLPRSGVAKVLVGSHSERVTEYSQHPLFNRLAGLYRDRVMQHIDALLASGRLAKDEHDHLVLGNRSPTSCDDPAANFFQRPHPRQLTGAWNEGWALDAHSRYAGEKWQRSCCGEMAYRLKYEGDLDALPGLVDEAMNVIAAHPQLGRVDTIVPVPPTAERVNDPVRMFAATLGQRLERPLAGCLCKTRLTEPQKSLHTLAQKRANVAGAFAVHGDVRGRRLLVVDDLFDSGATLDEAARTLLQAGAVQVNVLTLTKTIHTDG